MADHIKTEDDKLQSELDEILNRVDQLPELDNRSPEEIIGYDENGLPATNKPEPAAAPNDQAASTEPFDFAAWKKNMMGNPVSRAIVEDFLEHRHRDWELQIEADLLRRAKARGARARGDARRGDATKE